MRSRSQLPPLRLSLIALVVAILVFLAPRMASAASHHSFFVAPGGSDAVACSGNSAAAPFATLQKAIGCSAAGDVVSLAPSAAQGYPGIGAVAHNLTLAAQPGADARSVSIDAGQGELSVSPGANVTISGVTLSCPANDCSGKPTVTNEGTLTLSGDELTGNLGGYSAILNKTPESSSTPASLTISASTISGNAGRIGGAIDSAGGAGSSGAVTVSLINSTIAQNFSQTLGGAIANTATTPGSSVTLVNSTITANTAQSGAGGLYTLSPTTLANTILAANTSHTSTSPDCEAVGTTVTDATGGHNLIGNNNGCTKLVDGTDGDHVGGLSGPLDPRLAPLGFDGGPTATEPPLPGSPAIAGGSAATCETLLVGDVDQRGSSRNANSRNVCEIGSYDWAGKAPVVEALAVQSVSAQPLAAGKHKTITVTGTGFGPGAALSASAPGIAFSAVKVKNASTITAKETIVPGSEGGAYDLTVSLPGGSATYVGCLLVASPARG